MIKRSFTVTDESSYDYTEINISLSEDTTVVHISQGPCEVVLPRGMMFQEFLNALNEADEQ